MNTLTDRILFTVTAIVAVLFSSAAAVLIAAPDELIAAGILRESVAGSVLLSVAPFAFAAIAVVWTGLVALPAYRQAFRFGVCRAERFRVSVRPPVEYGRGGGAAQFFVADIDAARHIARTVLNCAPSASVTIADRYTRETTRTETTRHTGGAPVSLRALSAAIAAVAFAGFGAPAFAASGEPSGAAVTAFAVSVLFTAAALSAPETGVQAAETGSPETPLYGVVILVIAAAVTVYAFAADTRPVRRAAVRIAAAWTETIWRIRRAVIVRRNIRRHCGAAYGIRRRLQWFVQDIDLLIRTAAYRRRIRRSAKRGAPSAILRIRTVQAYNGAPSAPPKPSASERFRVRVNRIVYGAMAAAADIAAVTFAIRRAVRTAYRRIRRFLYVQADTAIWRIRSPHSRIRFVRAIIRRLDNIRRRRAVRRNHRIHRRNCRTAARIHAHNTRNAARRNVSACIAAVALSASGVPAFAAAPDIAAAAAFVFAPFAAVAVSLFVAFAASAVWRRAASGVQAAYVIVRRRIWFGVVRRGRRELRQFFYYAVRRAAVQENTGALQRAINTRRGIAPYSSVWRRIRRGVFIAVYGIPSGVHIHVRRVIAAYVANYIRERFLYADIRRLLGAPIKARTVRAYVSAYVQARRELRTARRTFRRRKRHTITLRILSAAIACIAFAAAVIAAASGEPSGVPAFAAAIAAAAPFGVRELRRGASVIIGSDGFATAADMRRRAEPFAAAAAVYTPNCKVLYGTGGYTMESGEYIREPIALFHTPNAQCIETIADIAAGYCRRYSQESYAVIDNGAPSLRYLAPLPNRVRRIERWTDIIYAPPETADELRREYPAHTVLADGGAFAFAIPLPPETFRGIPFAV